MTQKQFIGSAISTWDNHRILLWEALTLTKDSPLPVVEFGCGDGSTPYLSAYCAKNKRPFISYESNNDWSKKYNSILVADWDSPELYKEYSVALIDHAPGEHRHIAIANLVDKAKIMVIHDSEPVGAGNYMLDKIWHLFAYKIHLKTDGAWASLVSNIYNFNHLQGRSGEGWIIGV